MTGTFFRRLYLGTDFSDEALENVPNPRFELHYHVLYKSIQAGSILGMCVIGPIIGLIRGRSLVAVRNAALKGGKIGALIGIPAGPAMTEMVLSGKEETPERLYDRSYRIRYNTNQLRTDRFSTIGAIGGLAAASVMGAPFINGALVGFTAATISAGVYNTKIVQEKMRPAPKKLPSFRGEKKSEN